MHEDSWFDGTHPWDEDLGTFSIKTSHHDLPQDDLRPFHKDATGSYWNSVDAREIAALGCTYPELEKWKHIQVDGSYDREGHISHLKGKLNDQYNSARSAAEKAELTAGPGQTDGLNLMSLSSLQAVSNKGLVDIIGTDDYVVNVIYEK